MFDKKVKAKAEKLTSTEMTVTITPTRKFTWSSMIASSFDKTNTIIVSIIPKETFNG